MPRFAARVAVLACLALLVPVAGASCSDGDLDVSAGAGGHSCTTCYEVYANGGTPCGPGPSADTYQALYNCACGTKGPCASACGPSFCMFMSADMSCGTCLVASCHEQQSSCAAN